ncbi:MAG: insulinase family protein [Chlorobi bacterium]|nr:insulinase family protein [Chlorobiota bacterium]MCI0715980.1 insulinase family protein [Chlorobiota bacterium]
MKTKIKFSFAVYFFCFLLLFPASINGQVKTHTEGKYTYATVENDPLKTRIYKLDNGLTVYLTVYKNEPRIQTYIPIKAGSKNDPSDATGLAHYLEHMLFKGTDKFGSKDYEKEKLLIDKIINLYEDYRKTKDETKRKEIYKQIDSISGIAAKYAIANEYDKMMNIIGAKGTNAYTWVEQTVYTNDIPSNQLEKWLMIESERFRNPVMRLFHTELEAVYEEKNTGLDDDGSKAWETLFLSLYPTHQYGTQTTIGTIDHLKNPSIKKVIDYYNTHYVPNNMAVCLSGDLDPDKTIELIDKYFGYMQPKPIPEYIPAKEKPITQAIAEEVYGQDAEFLYMGYRFPGTNTKENDIVTTIDMILANSAAGLLDLNLNQSQKVLGSGSFVMGFKDYSTHILYGNPREGQKLEDVKDLLLGQVEKVKKGEFPDWLLDAIISDLKLSQIKEQESNRSRANLLVDAFIKDIPWEDHVNRIERLSKITKQDIVDFANKNYGNNYAVVYKRTGEDKNVRKVEKPQITPVEVNREDKTSFLENIASTPVEDIKPVFIDYKMDLTEAKIKNDIPLYYRKNEENGLFNLNFVIDIGGLHDKKIPIAASYFGYLGTSKYSPSELKEEFYKLGCSYSISSGDEETTISLSGLNENFDKAITLLEEVIADVQPNKEALDNLVLDILKLRADNKLNKEKILWDAMFSYGKYGGRSPFSDILTESELKSLTSVELIAKIKSLPSYKHKVLYYGPLSNDEISAKLNAHHNVSAAGLINPPEAVKYEELPTNENTVYVVNYTDMVQAEILMISKKEPYNKNLAPLVTLYNEYFGGGMSGIVFQDLRESKALAYGTFSSFTTPQKKERSHYNIAYIGTQADKLPEALKGLADLLTDMPSSEVTFNSAKDNLLQKINTERITKAGILSSWLSSQKLGLDYDIRKDIYERAQSFTLDDIQKFQKEHVKDSKYTILVLGDKNKLDTKALENYGTVKYLTLEEIFGY